MNRHINFFLMAVASLMAAACSGSSDDYNWNYTGQGYNPTTLPSGGTSTGSSSVDAADLTSFTIEVDSTNLSENDATPSESDSHYEDYVETETFKSTITITYNGSTATKSGDDNNLVSISGADVTATPTTKAIYILKGSTSEGSFRINDNESAKKSQIQLDGVNITNSDGPAINIQSGKRTYIVANEGTFNSFTDGSSYASSNEDQKATIFSEGELLFSGKGHIKVNSNAKNGIVSDDYVFIRPNTNLYIKSTSGNGIKGKDALIVKGGVINIEVSANASKGLSTDGYYQQDGGRVTAITSGEGEYDSEDQDVSACAGLKADSVININGGILKTKSTGKGGKGISTDQIFNMNNGQVYVITTGTTYTYSSRLDSKPKGIKADGNININGGTILVRATGDGGSEGIESKNILTINDGTVKVSSYDDAINSASHMYVKGGTVEVYASNNDGLDSNGNMFIQGGTVYAYGGGSPEEGLDANTEGGYKLYITGGTVFGIGGGATGVSSTDGSQPAALLTGSITSGNTISLQDGSSTLFSFKANKTYSNATILVSAPGMSTGTTYTLYNGSNSVGSASAALTTSSSMGGGMGGPGGMGGGFPGRW